MNAKRMMAVMVRRPATYVVLVLGLLLAWFAMWESGRGRAITDWEERLRVAGVVGKSQADVTALVEQWGSRPNVRSSVPRSLSFYAKDSRRRFLIWEYVIRIECTLDVTGKVTQTTVRSSYR